jgi:hypothetical protein
MAMEYSRGCYKTPICDAHGRASVERAKDGISVRPLYPQGACRQLYGAKTPRVAQSRLCLLACVPLCTR